MAENNERLFDQFPEVSYAEWRAKVEADLKGAALPDFCVHPKDLSSKVEIPPFLFPGDGFS